MPRYCIAQINSIVGDLENNAKKILEYTKSALEYSPDLILFPELTLTGYPPEDLLLKPGFVRTCDKARKKLIDELSELFAQEKYSDTDATVIFGHPYYTEDCKLHNSATVLRNGTFEDIYHKNLLPNYSVFDEERYFTPGESGLIIDVNSEKVGVVICEDIWDKSGPTASEAKAGARVIACLSASPYQRDKYETRLDTFSKLCKDNDVWLVYSNLIGGQDELIFDGCSMVMNPNGEVVAQANEFTEDLLVVDIPVCQPKTAKSQCESGDCGSCCGTGGSEHSPCGAKVITKPATKLEPIAEVYQALVLGVRDYIGKNRFRGVIIGLSGGVDSALTAAIAVDALGSNNVIGVTMPSQYSSDETISDAKVLAHNLGTELITLPIEKPHISFYSELAPHFEGAESDPENLTDQNIQARVRAVYLMALSNKFGMLVLNTSNKSEAAVGYGTLYGDMVGGFAAIKDVFKTDVWKLSRYVNKLHNREVIPASTIDRVPSAELRPDQEDRQSIPDYPVLDPILKLYIEKDMTVDEIIAQGFDAETVIKIAALSDRNEFKRRQSVMGTRVTPKAFGRDRRLPVTNRYRPQS